MSLTMSDRVRPDAHSDGFRRDAGLYSEARLDITPLPKVRRLVNVKMTLLTPRCVTRRLWLRRGRFGRDGGLKSAESGAGRYCLASVSELITDVPDKEMLGLNIVSLLVMMRR